MSGTRLAESASPYLRSHADNPVDWWPWCDEAFEEARRRDVPVLISIGYATCHWCHVMARESFSDPETAARLNDGFVAIKVDREEHPEVDTAYLAAASAFTPQLGWPLTVFTTPEGRAFYAGTYFPPRPAPGMPSFRQVLEAVGEAWRDRRDGVIETAAALTQALTAQRPDGGGRPPDEAALATAVQRLVALEDPEFGGFGGAPKFPITPAITFLLEHGGPDAGALAERLLRTMAGSPLRDPVEGGFFRYAVQRDWSEPHYERMLADNAQLLACYAAIGDADTATGVASFLLDILRVPDGLASGQDSESELDGVRNEGGYYRLDAEARRRQPRPPLDRKVLSGLNGLAIGALADAGIRLGRPDWVAAATGLADSVLALHGDTPPIARASLDGRRSSAPATLEDYGSLAGGLLRLALASGEARFAVVARRLVEACADVTVPGGGDPVLARQGIALPPEPSDGASPSGPAALADAALLLWAVSGEDAHRVLAERAIAPALDQAVAHPSSFGAALAVATRLARPLAQLVIIRGDDDDRLLDAVRGWGGPGRVLGIATPEQAGAWTDAGFELFADRSTIDGRSAGYYCEHFVCSLPTSEPERLRDLLSAG